MPRKKRIWVPGDFYHLVSRGNRREPLFRSAKDFEIFYYTLEQIHQKIPFELASFCFMTNHYHLLMRSEQESISKVMSLLNKRYASYFNLKYELSGHVFEKRFFAQRIYDHEEACMVSSYIHLNPVKAKMVKLPQHYGWSSYVYYYFPHLQPPKYMNMDYLLRGFEGTEETKLKKFLEEHTR